MNMAGKLSREGREIEVRHVAEVLAGMADGPGHRQGGPSGGMEATSPRFKENARRALDPFSSSARLPMSRQGFIEKRAKAAPRLPEFDELRDSARDIKDHTLANLDLYLEAYEARVREAGGHVHWAVDAEEACDIILDICKARPAQGA
jgi:L-lactate dehydrogenase complex protein LldF